MANQIPGGVSFQLFDAPQAPGDIPIPTAVGGGGAATAQLAQTLDRFSQRAGRLADAADAARGAEEGAQAAFDPEFRRREDNSVYARAFNRAGSQVYLARLETDARQQFEALSTEFGHDPEALGTAFTGFIEEQLQSPALQQSALVRAEYLTMAERARLPYERQAARATLAAERESQLASANDWLSTRLNALDRTAREAGLDETADAVLAGEVESLERHLVGMGPQEAFSFNGREYGPSDERAGIMSPVEIERALRTAGTAIAEGRVLGAFSRVDGLAPQRAFLDQFRSDVADNDARYADLDRSAITRMENAMAREISRRETAQRAAQRDVERRINRAMEGLDDIADAGLAVGGGRFEQLAREAEAIGDGDLAYEAREAGVIAANVEWAAGQPPAQLQEMINAERTRLRGQEATPFEARRLAAMERTLGEMNAALNSDPLSWAVRAGVADVPPIRMEGEDGAPSMEVLTASIAARAGTAETVAQRYGIAPRFFTGEEADTLAVQAQTGNLSRMAISQAVVDALGEDAPQALAQIAPNDPLLAHLGGMVSVGATRAARDAETGLRLSETEGFQSRVPSPSAIASGGRTFQQVQAGILGDVDRDQPQNAARARIAAEHIYNARAVRQGVTEFDGELYAEALNEALGAVRVHDGRGRAVQFGGVAQHTATGTLFGIGGQRHTVLAPNWLRADRFEDVVHSLTEEDIAALPAPPVDARGNVATPQDIRRMRLVSAGPGQYLLVNGDPSLGGAEMAMTPEGEEFILDLNVLRTRIAARHPDWVR